MSIDDDSVEVPGGEVANGPGLVNRLGGGDRHFHADREVAAELEAFAGGVAGAVRNAHAFKTAVVRSAAAAGVRQFLDLGCGIPREPYVYQVAREYDAGALVVSVEQDPSAFGWACDYLEWDERTVMVNAPYLTAGVLDHPVVAGSLDTAEPVGVLLVSASHTAPLGEFGFANLIWSLVRRLCPGSLLAVSQWAADDDLLRWAVNGFMAERTQGRWGSARSSKEIAAVLSRYPMPSCPPGPVGAWLSPGPVPARVLPVATPALVEFGGVIEIGGGTAFPSRLPGGAL
ncbi:SAM-dependent methyltransferase [Kitasatospora sp. NPDC058046]|uniref:SAM-dependent methyltransferase n=1 Tax=Kitasatospora sp. NPDC058046 TaxID=3346312 RepID=UPI0036DD3F7E